MVCDSLCVQRVVSGAVLLNCTFSNSSLNLFLIAGDVKSLLQQTTSANEAKFEAIAAAEEAKMKESNLQVFIVKYQSLRMDLHLEMRVDTQ